VVLVDKTFAFQKTGGHQGVEKILGRTGMKPQSALQFGQRQRMPGKFREELELNGAEEHFACPKAESNLKNVIGRRKSGRGCGGHDLSRGPLWHESVKSQATNRRARVPRGRGRRDRASPRDFRAFPARALLLLFALFATVAHGISALQFNYERFFVGLAAAFTAGEVVGLAKPGVMGGSTSSRCLR